MKNLLLPGLAILIFASCTTKNQQQQTNTSPEIAAQQALDSASAASVAVTDAENIPIEEIKDPIDNSVTAQAATVNSTKKNVPAVTGGGEAKASSKSTSPGSTTTAKKGMSHTAKGAIVGAAAGGVTGAIINKKDPLKGAIIGTAVGAAAGAGTGLIVDKSVKKKKSASTN